MHDEANSAIATMKSGMLDWQAIFADVDWFHWTGITPAISQGATDFCVKAVGTAKETGLTISSDINAMISP